MCQLGNSEMGLRKVHHELDLLSSSILHSVLLGHFEHSSSTTLSSMATAATQPPIPTAKETFHFINKPEGTRPHPVSEKIVYSRNQMPSMRPSAD